MTSPSVLTKIRERAGVCVCAADRREAGNSWLESEPDFR